MTFFWRVAWGKIRQRSNSSEWGQYELETKKLYRFVTIPIALFLVACAPSPFPPGEIETEPPPDLSNAGTWGLTDILPSSQDVPPVLPSDGVGISVDVLSGAISPGPSAAGQIVVHYNYYGCDFPSGEEVGDVLFEGVYLRREDEWNWNNWTYLSPVKRGAVTEVLQIPDSTPPASDYVVTVWSETFNRFQCWGNSNTFPISSTAEEPDFRVIRPHHGQWQKDTPQTIIWSFANLDTEGVNFNPESDFHLHLMHRVDGGISSALEIPTTSMSCYLPSRICSLPLIVRNDVSELRAGSYWINVDASVPEASWWARAESTPLRVCDDCATHEALTDVWIRNVRILTDGRHVDDHAEVDYYTDAGTTSVKFDVNLGYNGESPPTNCEITARSFIGRRIDGDDVFGAGRDDGVAVASGFGNNYVIHAGAGLPAGLTPGDTIPIRVKLIVAHKRLPWDLRRHLEVCEPETNRGNNTYDISVTLRDAGSRT